MSQANDTFKKEISLIPIADTVKTTTSKPQACKPEILTYRFIDIVNNGQVNASARLYDCYKRATKVALLSYLSIILPKKTPKNVFSPIVVPENNFNFDENSSLRSIK